MSTLGERIKLVRTNAKQTQSVFAEKIGIKRNTLAMIETQDKATSEVVMKAICREYKVNHSWLDAENGPMYVEGLPTSDDELIDEVLAGEDEFIKAFIKGIAKSPGGWEKMRDVFTSVQAELDKIKTPEDD